MSTKNPAIELEGKFELAKAIFEKISDELLSDKELEEITQNIQLIVEELNHGANGTHTRKNARYQIVLKMTRSSTGLVIYFIHS